MKFVSAVNAQSALDRGCDNDVRLLKHIQIQKVIFYVVSYIFKKSCSR
jgi:hypothetical protein